VVSAAQRYATFAPSSASHSPPLRLRHESRENSRTTPLSVQRGTTHRVADSVYALSSAVRIAQGLSNNSRLPVTGEPVVFILQGKLQASYLGPVHIESLNVFALAFTTPRDLHSLTHFLLGPAVRLHSRRSKRERFPLVLADGLSLVPLQSHILLTRIRLSHSVARARSLSCTSVSCPFASSVQQVPTPLKAMR
jgi:hypothetical protein